MEVDMPSTRIVVFAALTCLIPGLISCANLEGMDVDRQVEQQLAEHRISCLAAGRPAYSSEHTDCVLARYQERQRQLDRLRNAVAPAPQPEPVSATAPDPTAPAWTPQPVWFL